MKENKGTIKKLYIVDDETRFLIQQGKDDIEVIDNEQGLEQVLKNNCHYKNVVILVELGWKHSVSQFYGYEVAKLLMNSKLKGKFNLAFISTFSRQTLFQLNSGKNRVFTQRFPHYEMANNFNLLNLHIAESSERKFDYLKNYCLLESGILDRLKHDIDNLISNLEPQKLTKLLEDLNSNRDILSNEINAKAQKIAGLNSVDVKNVLSEIGGLILELQKHYNNPDELVGRKSHSKVLLIEDDPITLNKLHSQFSNYFHSIETFSTGTDAYKELENNADAYDVVITDMELLKGDFDDDKLGIDILELCEQKFPFLVTRVITSMPKNALGRLIRKNFGEIIFKSSSSGNVIPPFENLVEFVRQIEKEVKHRRQLRKMRGPEGSWWGNYLTRQLYLTQIQDPEKFTKIWSTAFEQATKFIECGFDSLNNAEKLAVEFRQTKEISNSPESGWEIIELLLTHRLIAFWFAAKHNWDEFYYTGDGINVYTNLRGFEAGIESRSSTAYLNTVLGISAQGISKKREERLKCKILPKNLFPKEIEWLEKNVSDSLDLIPLCDRQDCDDVYIGLIKLMKEYNSSFSEDVSYRQAIDLLREFESKFPNEKNTEKNKLLKQIFQGYIVEYIDALPSALKAVTTKIKEDVFYL